MNKETLRKEITEAYAFLRRHNHSLSDITLDFMLNESIKALDNESIVKTVDPDNLPKGEVLAHDGDGTLAVGELLFYSNENTVMCKDLSDEPLFYITHYIEQKDLLGMFE